jgi:hypothetical protein
MGALFYLFFPWGVILQAVAIVHFIRRRPDGYWLWIVLFGGGLGALVYILVEVVPDAGLLRGSFQGFSRRKRIKEVEAMILDNPSAGNYEELGDLYLDEKKYVRARECFDKAISSRTDHADPFYRRALCELEGSDFPAAVKDLERVIAFDRKYDYLRAMGLLAHAYANTGELALAEQLFREAGATSTLSETQYHYALFLSRNNRGAEARQMAQQVLNKKASLPRYLQRRERPWFRRARALLKEVGANAQAQQNA